MPLPERRKTRKIRYGTVEVGGGAPVSIQSMLTFPASSVAGALGQIGELAVAGCQIVRVSVRDMNDVDSLSGLCDESPIPVIADIHFDYRLAVAAAENGVAGLRINPGNIGGKEKTLAVAEAAAGAGIPIRIGVNAGSLEKELAGLYTTDPARALCESAASSLAMLEQEGFGDLVFSLKSSDPIVTVEANRLFSSGYDYPLHIGVTEAGPVLSGTARSVVALTMLLSEGIGDTVRVSLSGDPVREIVVAGAMLSALGLRPDLPRIISCPTCGRSHLDVAPLAERLEAVLPGYGSITVAVMGCEVNGPGEAKEADIGLAGTKKGAVLFRKGEIVGKVEGDFLEHLLEEIKKMKGKDT
ncbi:MAG: flavodoxin-dependent (E)-4-hydroxy-3-methylbut-2-enyl-diphosphate synthase [Candidatus Krumholzibacteria bacterium]|nr:flavodoxin-dependent (E)-4-hydroxy-3-methylbut-2-enyl-diphosphate synthase [Candidatus Krumholzibacteria bacterium]